MAPVAHDAGDVGVLRDAGKALRASLGFTAQLLAAGDEGPPPEGCKKIYFIRHGEGYHNVAQREWRAKADWDGKTEPYTLDQDPEGKFEDPLLTPKGEGQAKELQPRAAALAPELLVVSPMRRAMQTGLTAFERHVAEGDRRLPKTKLAELFPAVDFKLLESEEDPYWGDGWKREELQPRAAALAPELLVVSPMRRAMQTGLTAFERHVAEGRLPVLAHELCHERAGLHTCDRRLPKTKLAELFPAVDFKLLESEEDPYWGDGWKREDLPAMATRAGRFIEWLLARPEQQTGMETEQPATGAEQQADKSDAEDSDSDAPEVPLAELLEGLVLRDT
ncbi:Phosphomutase-like protein 3 [Symbiodinium microadriaticum]|uniref:Phosphomutase-like protein 3 n=1 Tax=Symbiodinium microadriaticum TaxID=2951 RepID=A0A1Q9CAX5_SYMMI|nr:Phosphomutase-like protein 3 [Symbiodinium microadriaticum]